MAIIKKKSFFQRYEKSDLRVMGIVLQLMFINTASINMLIPSYSVIIEEFGINDSLMYWPDSIAVLVTAFVMIMWGYFTDKLDRNKVIHGGAFLSTIGFIFAANCSSFNQLLFARIVTGAGMGFAIPVGYSILSDIISAEERSGLFGFLTIFSSISNGTGQFLSAFIGPLNLFNFGWRFPFLILSFLALFSVIQLIFVKLPEKGSTEEDLADLQDYEDMHYGYTISQQQLKKIVNKPTNKNLIINGFFAIVPGTIIIYSLITTFSHPELGLLASVPKDIRTQVSTIMAGAASIGYLFGSLVLASLGDYLFKKNSRNRTILAFLCNLIAIPLCALMLFQMEPISQSMLPIYPSEFSNENIYEYIFLTLTAIFRENPQYWGYLVFAFLGTFFSAGMVTNKKAVMVDINLPEHRGTATSFFQLTEQLGKSITLMVAAGLLHWLGSYQSMLLFGLIFWIPSSYYWYRAIKTVMRDIDKKKIVLRERTQLSFIDYFFELEIALDDGLQKIQDAKSNLLKNTTNSEILIKQAISRFYKINFKSKKKDLSDIHQKSAECLLKAKKLLVNLSVITHESESEKKQQLQKLYDVIDQEWEESDFGMIDTLYENGYLKVCEARLQRHYNPIETQKILQKAIDIYDRVIRLTIDRIIDTDERKINPIDYELQERIHTLLVNAQKSKSNTILLQQGVNKLVEIILQRDISEEDLKNILDLSNQYNIKLKDIITESLDRRTVRKIMKDLEEIDDLFKKYEKWQAVE